MTTKASQTGPRRFYETVDLKQGDAGFEVLLDARPVRTPARAALCVASDALARAIAQEWETQGEKIDPATMPMTKRANTAIDRVQSREREVVADIVSYAGADLLCYRADSPEGLIELQCTHWNPVLDWAKQELDASFAVQAGITHVDQPETSLSAISKILGSFDHLALTPLHTMTTLTGSALLVLAHVRGRLQPDEVWNAAHVDEDWQVSQWGEDAEATARRAVRRAEFDADCRFLELVRP